MKVEIQSDHPDAAALLRFALQHYAACNDSMATLARTRNLHPGETREHLERRAAVYTERAIAVNAMLAQLPPALEPRAPI